MEINYEVALAEDTLFLVDLCPKQNFPQGSKEDILAQKWLDHLCTYEVDDLDDRRLRNIYISHLCTALIQKQLYGPFLKEPPRGKLEKIDFHAAPTCLNNSMMLTPQQQLQLQPDTYSSFLGSPLGQSSNVTMGGGPPSSSFTVVNATQNLNATGMESQGHISVGSTNLSFNVTSGGAGSSCNCPPKPCTCPSSGQPCSCNRSSAGADTSSIHDEEVICNYIMQKLNFTPEFLNNFDATLTSFMDLCKEASLQSTTQAPSKSLLSVETSKNYFLPKSQCSVADTNVSSAQCSVADTNVSSASQEQKCVSPPLDLEDIREASNKLLAAIMAELSGNVDPGSNDYLDRELARYKTFVMENSHLSTHLRSLKSDLKLRNCLLLSLQNDLVKLLNESK